MVFKKNKLSWNKGLITPESTKEKQRQAKLGKHLTEEHKNNISKSLLGKPKSESAKENMGKAQQKIAYKKKGVHFSPNTEFKKGQPSQFKNKKRSKESIEKQKESVKNQTEEEKRIASENRSKAGMGRIPWNKGLKGVCTAWNKGLPKEKNPNYGRKISQKQKDILAKCVKDLWDDKNHRKFMHERFSGKGSNFYGHPPKHGKGIWYESPLQGQVYLRSSYELKYAQYLDQNHILWMYELETFEITGGTYTPDFFLIKDNKFIEIKGWMSERSQNKITKFQEEYPFDLKILYKQDLQNLGIKL